MKVGDLVQFRSSKTVGIIVKIDFDHVVMKAHNVEKRYPYCVEWPDFFGSPSWYSDDELSLVSSKEST